MNLSKPYGLIFYAILLIHLLETEARRKKPSSQNEEISDEEVCDTTGCQDAAKLIKENIDEKIDPCDHFYKFACGGFIKKNKIPKNRLSISRMQAVTKKVNQDVLTLLEGETQPGEPRIFELVRNYFKACMDTETIESLGNKPILDVIKRLGGWPVIEGDSWDEDKFDLLETLIKLRKLGYQHKYLVNIYVFNDFYNTSSYKLYIDKAEQILSATDLDEDFYSPTLQAYYRWMVDVAVELGADRSRAAEELEAVVIFEKVLSSLPYVQRASTYKIETIDDLVTNIPYFPWLSYLNKVTQPIITLNLKSKVSTDEPYYLELLEFYLKDVDKRTLANYLVWRAVADSIPHLSENLRKKREKYYVVSKESRRDQCVGWINSDEDGIPAGVSALYVRNSFRNDTKNEVREIVHAIADQFQNRLQKVPWLDEDTKRRAYLKSEMMRQIVGHPDELLNDKALNKYVKSLSIDSKKHFKNFLSIKRFHFDNSLALYNEQGNYVWTAFSGVTETNAFYYRISNSFVILAGILRRPLFHPDWPSYAKYGSIGFIIGHEMMHAYDSTNFLFDETGSFKRWYSNDSEIEYYKRLRCFIDQYAQFRDENVNAYVDGKLTLDENVADNVGLKVSYDAYKKSEKLHGGDLRLPGLKYTPDQLFWISSVNFLCSRDTEMYRAYLLENEEHTPDDFRALGEMANSIEFATAFNCPEGSPMNPAKKCKLM